MINNKIVNQVIIPITYLDVDMGGVMYYGNYNKYADYARSSLLLSLNIDLYNNNKESWQCIELDISYKKPVKLKDTLIINTYILEVDIDYIKYQHNFLVNDVLMANQIAKCILVDSNINKLDIPNNIINKFKNSI